MAQRHLSGCVCVGALRLAGTGQHGLVGRTDALLIATLLPVVHKLTRLLQTVSVAAEAGRVVALFSPQLNDRSGDIRLAVDMLQVEHGLAVAELTGGLQEKKQKDEKYAYFTQCDMLL